MNPHPSACKADVLPIRTTPPNYLEQIKGFEPSPSLRQSEMLPITLYLRILGSVSVLPNVIVWRFVGELNP